MKTIRHFVCLSILLTIHSFTNVAYAIPEFDWGNQITGSGDNNASSAITDSRDEIIVTGSFENTAELDASTRITAIDGKDIYIAKYSPGGSLLWSRRFGGNGYDVANAITVDALRNIYIAGAFEDELSLGSTTLNERDGSIFFAKLAPDGSPLWCKTGRITGKYCHGH